MSRHTVAVAYVVCTNDDYEAPMAEILCVIIVSCKCQTGTKLPSGNH